MMKFFEKLKEFIDDKKNPAGKNKKTVCIERKTIHCN